MIEFFVDTVFSFSILNMLSLLWLPLFPMRSHLLIVLFHGNENVMHYFCLAFNIFSFLSTVWQNMSVFRSLFILLEIQWILGCVIFFFFSKLRKFSATIYSNVFSELLFFFSCLDFCFMYIGMSDNVPHIWECLFLFLKLDDSHWFIFKVTYSFFCHLKSVMKLT